MIRVKVGVVRVRCKFDARGALGQFCFEAVQQLVERFVERCFSHDWVATVGTHVLGPRLRFGGVGQGGKGVGQVAVLGMQNAVLEVTVDVRFGDLENASGREVSDDALHVVHYLNKREVLRRQNVRGRLDRRAHDDCVPSECSTDLGGGAL